MSDSGFNPNDHLMKVSGQDGMSQQHRKRISAALKRYNENGGHLASYRVKGPDHSSFQTGISAGYYRRIAFEAYGESCQRCGSNQHIIVHHRDRNRKNNVITNP
jgi:hypothetical protein